ncbi:MAG: type 2 isopentenyl-diphosphate Delta-isomerase [Candidatus Ranarchaeia archaeon]|jgi:isopentenyl-diphosphate delta-isomerase
MDKDKTSNRETHDRKLDHIRLSLEKDVQSRKKTTGLADVTFIHDALPEIDFHKIDTSLEFFGKKIAAPLVISAITGGHPESAEINAALGKAAEKCKIVMEVGSQRAAIEDDTLAYTYAVAREKAPTAFLVGNIGAAQLSEGWGVSQAKKAIEMIDADALAIHLNPLHEVVQPEGNVDYSNVISQMKILTKGIDTPIIAKETGAGLSRETAGRLIKSGVKILQVEGAGGTSFAAVEVQRAIQKQNDIKEHIGELFWDWGIPTGVSTAEICHQFPDVPLIASGGIRTGVELAKALALGARLGGMAFPFLVEFERNGYDGVVKLISRLILELKTTMFLIGAEDLQALRRSNVIVRGEIGEWLKLRGIDLSHYANRR